MPKGDLLFSVPKEAFDFQATKGTGKGGQARNKTSSAIRCKHLESGATGYAEDDRSQHVNRRLAWQRCIATTEFQAWLKKETARHTGAAAAREAAIKRAVEVAMKPGNIKVEVVEDDEWVEVNERGD